MAMSAATISARSTPGTLAAPKAEIYVEPGDITAVHQGQTVLLRLMTVSGATTPEIEGIVSEIGADLIRVGDSAAYRVTVTIPDADRGALLPGTPALAFIATEARTPFSYLARPFTDYFTRALRD